MNTESSSQPSPARDPLRFGPLGIVAIVWVLIAVLFPSKEPGEGGSVSASSPNGSGDSTSSEEFAADGTTSEAAASTEGGSGAGSTEGGDGGGAGAATGPAGVGATGGEGVSKGGVKCGPGVRQVPLSTYAAPCTPAWSGDNRGATARGVTGDTIRIVRRKFPESANSQAIDQVEAQAGAAPDDVTFAVRDVFAKHFNETYELYGRKVEFVDYESRFGDATAEAQSKGREEACLDADVVANELKAFGVAGEDLGPVTGPFAECAAQRGLVVFNGAPYFSANFYRKYHPYVWATPMDCERISYQVAEYIGRRLMNKKAKWAGDAVTQGKNRIFGTYVPNNDEYQRCADAVEKALVRDFGEQKRSRYNYTLDVSRFPDEAARAIVQFQADGVTTIVTACDPISIIFLTQSATSQNYRPEWMLIGVALQDTDNAAQLYDQEQVDGHMFGLSQLGSTYKMIGPASEPGRIYKKITGKDIPPGTSGAYSGLVHIYNLLQAAGPNLTAESMANGARALPPGGAPDFPFGYWSFADGPDGTKGGGDHTAIDDSREIYWTRKFVSKSTGKAGTFVETYGGKRFRNGEWPAEDPPVYP